MFRSWRLGTAFGIPLYLHPTFLLLPVLVLFEQAGDGWFNAAAMTALLGVVFGCVLLHELGHALMARAFGIDTHDITLYPIGGVASLERMSERPAEELLIALAGPAVNLAIAFLLAPVVALAYPLIAHADALTFHLGDGLGLLAAKFALLVLASNVGLRLFNLLPAFPSDGGRVLRALLALMMDRVRATEIAAGVGVGMAGLIGLLVFVTGNPLILLVALFLAYAGRQEVLYVRRQAALARQDAWQTAEAHDAPPSPDFSGFRWDRRDHVWVLWRHGRPIEVYEGGAE